MVGGRWHQARSLTGTHGGVNDEPLMDYDWRNAARLKGQHLSKTTAIHKYDPEDRFTEREVKSVFKIPRDRGRRDCENIQTFPLVI